MAPSVQGAFRPATTYMPRLGPKHILLPLMFSQAMVPVMAARAPDSSFILSATGGNFDSYYPTYLANGYWSLASTLLGTSPALSFMAGVMDYTDDDVSRPAALPSWNEIDYFDGGAWLNGGASNHSGASLNGDASHGGALNAQTQAGYRQTLDMHDGVLRTKYRWIDGARATEISVTCFVSESSPHLAVVRLELMPHFSGRVRLRFALQSPPAPQRLALARMNARQFSAAAAAAHQDELAAGGNRGAIWYPGQVIVAQSGAEPADTVFMAGAAVRGKAVALAAAVALPRDLQRVRKTVERTADGIYLEIEARVRSSHRYRFTKFVAASSAGWGGGAAQDVAAARGARQQGFGALLRAHARAWHALWRSDIRVGGGSDLQRTI